MYRRPTTILTTTMMLSLAACAAGGPGDDLEDDYADEIGGDVTTPRYLEDDERLSASASSRFHREPARAIGTPSRRDRDGDGFDDTVDCAPDDPYVHPEAPEICNGKDDDCDGRIDQLDRSTAWPGPDPLEAEMDPQGDSGIDAIQIEPSGELLVPFSPHERTWFHHPLDHDYFYWTQEIAADDSVTSLQCQVINLPDGMTVDIQLGYTLDDEASGSVVEEVTTCSASSENDVCILALPAELPEEAIYAFLAGVFPGEGVNSCANQYQLECWFAEPAK